MSVNPQEIWEGPHPGVHTAGRRWRLHLGRDALAGYLFIAPQMLGVLVFVAFPVAASFFLSLTDWRIGGEVNLIGVKNYLTLAQEPLFWKVCQNTLTFTFISVPIAMLFGLPLGIAMAAKDSVASVVRPILDLMQTMPAFVYLIPAAMFFGLGAVPGTIATVIFSMPPVVRLTNLGIRQVDVEFVEAGHAFGCTASIPSCPACAGRGPRSLTRDW